MLSFSNNTIVHLRKSISVQIFIPPGLLGKLIIALVSGKKGRQNDNKKNN
jgi:hypothetical protein